MTAVQKDPIYVKRSNKSSDLVLVKSFKLSKGSLVKRSKNHAIVVSRVPIWVKRFIESINLVWIKSFN